ncbi:fermentation associated protein [Aspergillus sclerotialis]|uniref:Fermentation associated protein n=1 Tax=Aspergillus sclerotialis TaxID=2070753 RepID=A0A3A2ZBP6_9EURO|nr:fermentation associated protein [Aspergillus sclerotialis]
MASTNLSIQWLSPNPSFNWFFLLELIVSVILVLFFLLYFNRLFATLVSYGIRAFTWHHYRAYVDIHAIQVSLLSGRIFFKGIRYHGVNETIFIHGGFVTWHYWRRSVKKTDLSGIGCNGEYSENGRRYSTEGGDASTKLDGAGEQGGLKGADALPYRITLQLYGVEWFIYNRTPAYDSILAGFGMPAQGDNLSDTSPSPEKPRREQFVGDDKLDSTVKKNHTTPSSPQSTSGGKSAVESNLRTSKESGGGSESQDQEASRKEIGLILSRLLKLLPLKLKCNKGAIVIGNENTRSILTTVFDGATGSIEAGNAGPLDLYRQIFSFQFRHPVMQLRPNPDFKQNQFATAKGLSSAREDQSGAKRKRDTLFNYRFQKRRIWHSVRDLVPYFQTSVESFRSQKQTGTPQRNWIGVPDEVRWAGLSRYLDETSQEDHEKWNSIEYGRFSTLLDSPSMTVTYYWDIAGRVLPHHTTPSSSARKVSFDINGASPPEWGIDVKLEGGSINYGPWADRERVGLQNVFFPNSYRSSDPATPLKPGDPRQSTAFRFRVEISDELTLRIPTREQSKDWQWKGRADTIGSTSKVKKQQERGQRRRQSRKADSDRGPLGGDIRPFGWLSLRVARDSTIDYTMDMAASKSGFSNQLCLDLRDSKLLTSVNHGVLWQCPRQLVICDLSNPLSWNSLRTWDFNVESQDLELFLLRDHIFLLTDLVTDWTSGPGSDYYTFVPFIYNLNLSFSNFRLFVNVNDLNIISNPADLDDNRLVVIKGSELTSHVEIPLTKYKPEQNTVEFNVKLNDGRIDFLTPLWDTLHTFLQDKSAATLENLSIDGSYNYYLTTSSELTDTLVLNIDGVSPVLYAFGFLIRSFMTVKENYFGDDMHFKTLEEFQELANDKEQLAGPHGMNPNRKSNDMDVIVHVTVENPLALLPEHLYDHSKCLRLNAPFLEADLRFTNYYMDMQFLLSPLKVALESQSRDSPFISPTQLFIDGISIHGHRLFGLPPSEPTYVCNWDFDVGRILGECSTEFMTCLVAGLKSFDMTFDNEENILHPLHPIALYDVTFLRANIDMLHISVILDQTAFILSAGSLTTRLNDWTNSEFSKRLSLLVPEVAVTAVDRCLLDARPLDVKVPPLALFQTTVNLKMAQRKSNIDEIRKLQQDHIRAHDKRTQRTQWLLFDSERAGSSQLFMTASKQDPPTIPMPPMPEPILNDHHFPRLSSTKHSFESRSPASGRNFLVPSETSSLRSVRKMAPRSTKSSSSLRSEASKLHASAHRNLDSHAPGRPNRRESSKHGRFAEEINSTMGDLDSNPWAMPEFSLYKIALDASQLPSDQSSGGYSQTDNVSDSHSDPEFSHFESKATRTNFSCMFPLGVRGFCTPEFLFRLSSLLEELQPRSPVQLIDSLQKEVISDIVAYQKSMDDPRQSTGFAIRIPSILFKLVNLPGPSNQHQVDFRDEYNIGIYNLKTEFRTRVERRKDDLLEGIKENTTIHAAANSLWLSVESNGANPYQEKAAFSCHLGDLNFWLATAPNVRSHLQIKDFDAVTSSKSVEQLAFLVRRTTMMSDNVTSSFQYSSSLKSKRLRYLTYSLTKSSADIPDPTFLTRISYVLRATSAHLRQNDSWKIISRIRNVYNSLSSDRKGELMSKCLENNISLPHNAKSTVVSSFDQWRAWDLAHVDKSYVIKKVWGTLESKSDSGQKSVSLSSTVGTFRFSVDPGPYESDFIVQSLSAAVSVTPGKDVLRNPVESSNAVVVVQSYCSSTSLRLRWEILDLVEEVMRTMSTVTLESATPSEAISSKQDAQSELQIIVGTDQGSITLDGINLRTSLSGNALRGSLVRKMDSEDRVDNLTVLLSADSCSLGLSSLSKALMLWQIGVPYTYCSRVSKESETEQKNDWKIATSCKKLRFDMKEDPLGLLHTAERLIEDEIRSIRQIVDNFVQQTSHGMEAPPEKDERNQFCIAMFLDDYQLTFLVLPFLTYTISGEVARASLMPTQGSKIEVDFDLKKNSHIFLSNEGDKWHTLSILEIPPINGRVLANMLPSQTEVDADITIELIHLEASAVRSLLGALMGPEASNLMSDLKDSVKALQVRLDNVLALDKKISQPKKSTSGHSILYKARLTMAGLGIHAIAPGLSGKNYSADLNFSLGMVRMRLGNGLEKGYPMEYPEFNFDASQIRVDLKKREKSRSRSYGSVAINAKLLGTSVTRDNGEVIRVYHLSSSKFDIELFAETAALVVDVATHLQDRIKTLDLSHEVKRLKRLRQRSQAESPKTLKVPDIQVDDENAQYFFDAIYTLEFNNLQIAWNMTTAPHAPSGRLPDDLVFSIRRVDLSNSRKNAAKLRIEAMELQMVPYSDNRRKRSLNSALMPEVVFNVAYSSTGNELRLAFQAAGKSLDLRATSEFILPASMIRDSIASASQTLREGNAVWATKPSTNGNKERSLFGNKRLRSVLVDVDFAGAVVSLQGKHTDDQQTMLTATLKGSRLSEGKYGQYVQGDVTTTATLRTPGVAVKVQFEDNGIDDSALNAELKVDASTNVLYPTLVPLIKQMTATVKEVMGEQEQPEAPPSSTKLQPQKLMQETPFNARDPSTIFGRCKINMGILICKQEFSMSCQPIARVAATAKFESVYVTVNTVQSDEHGRFLSLLVACNSLGASVKHVYSNESTASFEVNSIVMSIMNSKHLRHTSGISAILRVSPMAMALNAKQVQDFMLFREIWLSSNDDTEASPTFQPPPSENQTYIVQRYQQVASTSVFPWNTTIAIEKLEIQLDLGSTLGKSQFGINDLWLSSKKTSDREQTLCIGFDTIGIESKGRMSGMVQLRTLKIRTSIQWPDETLESQTPLIQASVAFHQLQAKASFDYQPFLVADVAMFKFLMYNVRGVSDAPNERLFSILEGDKVQVFCTSLTASQCLALFQAWQRLAQDKQAAYEASLREIELYLRRKSSVFHQGLDLHKDIGKDEDKVEKAPISLQTGVVVTIKAINIGAYPSSLFDNQVFKLEANDAQAQFDVSLEEGKIHSALGLTLGELRVALSSTNRPTSADMENLSVDEVASRATGARGGTILKVPQLVARMETWQWPGSHQISYIFKSTFEGKVDVGWNYSRISFIRDMWDAHSRALASRLGKPLAPSAVRITGGPSSEGDGEKKEQEKITAVVNVPQSKYMYTALEPPVIETPQLRDMGEATPPLEWIGLQRDKLPNVTHQIIIVTLLEIAKEVEDAYSKILGAS